MNEQNFSTLWCTCRFNWARPDIGFEIQGKLRSSTLLHPNPKYMNYLRVHGGKKHSELLFTTDTRLCSGWGGGGGLVDIHLPGLHCSTGDGQLTAVWE